MLSYQNLQNYSHAADKTKQKNVSKTELYYQIASLAY